MKIIEAEKWSVSGNGSRTIVFNKNQAGDTVASELYVNPLSACTLAVTGYVSPDDTTGNSLSCVDMVNLEKKSSVTTAGNYMYVVGSYYKVEITVTGTSDVLLKWLF